MKRVITDREIQLARERAYDAKDRATGDMLQQLLDFRRIAREVAANHDYRAHYNRAMHSLDSLVNQSGCQWWQCDQAATTLRIRAESHSRGDASPLCCAHADEGEQKGLWLEDHPMNVEWRKCDHAARMRAIVAARDTQRDA